MENVIRKILDYPINKKPTRKEQGELITNIIALSLFVLSKKGYNFPDDCAKLVFDTVSDGADAEFDHEKKELIINKDFFMRDDALYEDLPLLAHEVCHLAQEYNKNKRVESLNRVYVDPIETENLNTVLKHFNDKHKLVSRSDFKSINDYNMSFYYLQSSEFEAYCFMIELLNTLINTAKTLDLTPHQKENLNIIVSENLSVPLCKKFIEFKRDRYNKNIQQKSQMLTNAFLTDYFKNHPKAFDSFKLKKENQEASDMLCWLVPALMICYNDELAHKYFNVLVHSPQEIEQEVVFLVQKTKIKLTSDETKLFLPFIDKFNKKYHSTLTLDIILSEKEHFERENSRLAGDNVM